MGMKSMYDLRDMLCKELDEISRKGELGAGDLDIVHKLASTIKNLDKIEAMEGGYSSRFGSLAWKRKNPAGRTTRGLRRCIPSKTRTGSR